MYFVYFENYKIIVFDFKGYRFCLDLERDQGEKNQVRESKEELDRV